MDRTRLTAWTKIALPLGAMLVAGCGSRQPSPSPASAPARPALLELGSDTRANLRPISPAMHVGLPSDPAPLIWPAADPQVIDERLLTSREELQGSPAVAAPSVAETIRSAPAPVAPPQMPVPPPAMSEQAQTSTADMSPTETLETEVIDAPEAHEPHLAKAPSAKLAMPAPEEPLEIDEAPEAPDPASAVDPDPASAHVALPWAKNYPRTSEMQAVMSRAFAMSRHALDLAGRGATYSARHELQDALRLVAQTLDAQQQTALYSKAAASGLEALHESRDFFDRSGKLLSNCDVAAIVAPHRTQILKGAPAEMSPLAAVGRYYTYACEQLAIAVNEEPAGSLALYGLGKIAGGDGSKQPMSAVGEAMTLYQSAIVADGRNFRASHELGVLLARAGRLEQARDMFLQSISISPQPATWRNLAVVHEQLGQRDLAASARQEALQAEQSSVAEKSVPVDFVDATTFAKSGAVPNVPAQKPQQPTPAAETQKAAANSRGLSAWLPWRSTSRR